MTRNMNANASRTLLTFGSGPARRRVRHASPCVENLEYRLSLSSVSTGASASLIKQASVVPADLNPQPLPPGIFHVEPMVQGAHIG